MSGINIYCDESGDLGWSFDKQYRDGGSSRHLTIASLLTPKDKKDLPKRLIKELYKKSGWNVKKEKKWVDMSDYSRIEFANLVLKLVQKNTDILLFSITVKKQNVAEHIRNDQNKLYNYMLQLSLLDEMAKHDEINLIPDPRSIKVASGNSLHDYMVMKLWFDKGVKTRLNTTPCDSTKSLSIQFADMLSGVVQSHFEDANSGAWKILRHKINVKTLYF